MSNATDKTLHWISDKQQVHSAVWKAKTAGKRVGLVPTMGNLHYGHASLLETAARETDFVVATIFVNPIQFGPGEDFDAYPRTPEEDRNICQAAGADVVFAPSVETMYPPGSCTRVQVVQTEKPLCGGNRPGHFVGVATVVAKLFHIIPADAAFFGEKDFQQVRVIQKMVEDLDFPIQIRACPTVREADGLAMSSRNRYLTPQEREQAVVLKQSLDLAQNLVHAGKRDPARIMEKIRKMIAQKSLARIDYVEIVDPDRLEPVKTMDAPALLALAVRFGKARLIDNAIVRP